MCSGPTQGLSMLNLAMTFNACLPYLGLSCPFEPPSGKDLRPEWARLQSGSRPSVLSPSHQKSHQE